MLLAEGHCHLVVTHKSILRALLCTALGLPTLAFRAVDVHNGGVCVFRQASMSHCKVLNSLVVFNQNALHAQASLPCVQLSRVRNEVPDAGLTSGLSQC